MGLHLKVRFPENFRYELEFAYLDQMVLKPGDDIVVNEENDSESIARIRSLFFDCYKGKVALDVQWYYKPTDIKGQRLRNRCSEIELFLSDSYMEVDIGCVDGKVKVCSLEEVLEMDEIDEVFFTRANWCAAQQKFDPPIDKWKTGCLCQEVINPDKPFKICTKCHMYLHVDCLEKAGHQKCPKCDEEL